MQSLQLKHDFFLASWHLAFYTKHRSDRLKINSEFKCMSKGEEIPIERNNREEKRNTSTTYPGR